MAYAIEIQGEFNYIVRSFQFVAQMFGSGSDYMGIMMVLGCLGLMFGGIAAISNQGSSGRSAVTVWLIQMVSSSAIIFMIISDKTEVIIHDTTTNQLRSVGGIPEIMAATAYFENRTSNAIKDIISTVMQPIIAYEDIGKGKGFELLASYEDVAKNFYKTQPYTLRSIEDYFEKCVVLDNVRQWIPDDALHSTPDLWASIKSDTEAYGSVVYSPASPRGDYYPCTNAYNAIGTQLSVTQIQNAINLKCKSMEGKDPAVIEKCSTNIGRLVSNFLSGGESFTSDLNAFTRSYLAAYAMRSSLGPQYYMLADVNKKNMAQAMMAEKMLPRLRGMMYGMIIGIFPLLIGFLWFNPIKTIIFYAGMLLLMVFWGAIDTFMDMQYQNEVYDMFVTMRIGKWGYNQMFDIPNLAADAVSLYGSGRWMALGLATAIVGALAKVSTQIMSAMGSQLGASAQSAAGAGAGFIDSAGKGKLTEQIGNDLGYRILDQVPNWNPTSIATQKAAGAIEGIGTAQGKIQANGGSFESMSDYTAVSSFFNTATEKASLEQTGKLFDGNFAKAADLYGANSAKVRNYDANRSEEKLNTLTQESGKNLADVGKDAGRTEGVGELLNISNTDTRLKLHGGYKQLEDFNKKQINFNEGKDKQFLERQKETYNGIDNAAAAAGNSQHTNQITTNETAQTNHDRAIGEQNATYKEAAAYGMSVEQYSEFQKRGYSLSAEDAERMNSMYKTNAFAEGQQVSASISKDGKLNNVKLTDNASGVSKQDKQLQKALAANPEALEHLAAKQADYKAGNISREEFDNERMAFSVAANRAASGTDNGESLKKFARGEDIAVQDSEKTNAKTQDIYSKVSASNAGDQGVAAAEMKSNLAHTPKGEKVGNYTFNGEKHIVLGDDMKAAQTTYSGLFSDGKNEYSGSIVANGDGKIVNASGQLGKELHGRNIETFHIDQSTAYQNTLQSVLKKNSAAVERVADMQVQFDKGEITKDQLEAEKLTFSAALAHDISNYKSQSVKDDAQSSLQTYSDIGANAGFSIPLGIASFGGSASLGQRDVDSNEHTTSVSYDPRIKEIYNSISNTNEAFDSRWNAKEDGIISNQEAAFKKQVLADTITKDLNQYAMDKMNQEKAPTTKQTKNEDAGKDSENDPSYGKESY